MTTIDVGDYRVINDDDDFRLVHGGDIDDDKDFDVPDDLLTTGRAVISWNDRKEGSGADVSYNMFLNGTNVRSEYKASQDLYYSRQEVIASSLLRPGSNTLEIRLSDGDAQLAVNDMVVHFRRRVEV